MRVLEADRKREGWGVGQWWCDHPKSVTGYWQSESEAEDEEEEDEKRVGG